jgi:hypothetical protein
MMLQNAKFTWKSSVGLLSALAGALTATNIAALHLPPSVSAALVAAGVGLLAFERAAEALDNAVKTWWESLPASTRSGIEDFAHVVDQEAVIQEIRQKADRMVTDVRNDLENLVQQHRQSLSRIGTQPVPTVLPAYKTASDGTPLNEPPPEPFNA